MDLYPPSTSLKRDLDDLGIGGGGGDLGSTASPPSTEIAFNPLSTTQATPRRPFMPTPRQRKPPSVIEAVQPCSSWKPNLESLQKDPSSDPREILDPLNKALPSTKAKMTNTTTTTTTTPLSNSSLLNTDPSSTATARVPPMTTRSKLKMQSMADPTNPTSRPSSPTKRDSNLTTTTLLDSNRDNLTKVARVGKLTSASAKSNHHPLAPPSPASGRFSILSPPLTTNLQVSASSNVSDRSGMVTMDSYSVPETPTRITSDYPSFSPSKATTTSSSSSSSSSSTTTRSTTLTSTGQGGGRTRATPGRQNGGGSGGRGLGISLGMGSRETSISHVTDEPPRGGEDEDDEELANSSFVYSENENGNVGNSSSDALRVDSGSNCGGTGEEGHQESVMVHVRLRPPKAGEKCAWIASVSSGALSLEPGLASQRVQQGSSGPFSFDGLLTGSENRPVYISVARPLVRSALAGYDAVVFAYGQTASGKTFTLSGDESGSEQGIIPRAVRDIFRGIRQSSDRREYLLRASYLEIWNENVKDLLEPSNVPQVRDDRRKGGKGTFVHPLREEIVTTPAQVRDLLRRGQENRHVGATDWNERSSRSHTCFKMTIESWERDADSASNGHSDLGRVSSPLPADASSVSASRAGKKIRISELSLIDLAGSEKYVSQGSDRRAEGAHINKSLLTLGKVIFALSEKSSSSSSNSTSHHVPYRDSKLTRILQNSLSGNARVAVVCTINPSPNAVEESLSTLNFAKRVKKVSLHARRNEVEGGGDPSAMGGAEARALLVRYREEAIALRKKVAELQNGAATPRLEDARVRQLQERLDVIGNLVLRGGGIDEGDSDEEDEMDPDVPAARPVTPARKATRGFDFDDPPHVLQEKLYNATTKISRLEGELASRPSLPASASDRIKDEMIARLENQVKELEMVCEAQAVEAPPKIREDVEREWSSKVRELEAKLEERERFLAELGSECERLRRANKRLIRLAHLETADMVASLTNHPTPKPRPGSLAASVMKNRRPASVLGGGELENWRSLGGSGCGSNSPTTTNFDSSPFPQVKPTSNQRWSTLSPNGFLRAPPSTPSTTVPSHQNPNGSFARFRPRRSVSHDTGFLESGIDKVEREMEAV
ncbi:kinesin-domain-containing protein [Violaceomyces palustris]|uniref:Kinesin-domain-containing protein n=1 Tax=Violaceomyces palustris TaxID=1673888 RepID=A0ACD0NZU1_9BASI|nr:kinesin-domain-containing protein [Violaceomyces palustris]